MAGSTLEAPMRQDTRPATYADLKAVPDHLVVEILDGTLVTQPRPAPKPAKASAALGVELGDAFERGRSGPGGWVFFDEPELHLGEEVVVPDIAGWRIERLSVLQDTAYFELAPDWVCEVLSPSTEHRDRGRKRQLYADAGVAFCWLVDPRAELIETFMLRDGAWMVGETFVDDAAVRAPPFDAIAFPLPVLWPLKSADDMQKDQN